MTNPAPEELIPFLAHKDPLVRNYTARLLGLDNEERFEIAPRWPPSVKR